MIAETNKELFVCDENGIHPAMRVLLVEPGVQPREVVLVHSLEAMQHVVGGLIQAIYPFEDEVALVCNDEGKILGLPLNRRLFDYDIIAGTFFICGLGESDFASLTPEQVKKYRQMFLL